MMLSASSIMARVSATPNDIGFKHAVEVFRKSQEERKKAADLKSRLIAIL